MLLAGLFGLRNFAKNPHTDGANEFPESRSSKVALQTPYREPRDGAAGQVAVSNISSEGFSQVATRKTSPASKREDLLTRSTATWRSQLPDVESVLGLHPEEYEQLLTILAHFGVRIQELDEASPARDTFAEEQDLYKQRAAAIKEYLGEARNQEWRSYLDTTGIRAQVNKLASALENSSAPLKSDQRPGLVNALIETNRRYQAEKDERHRREPTSSRTEKTILTEYKQYSVQMHSPRHLF